MILSDQRRNKHCIVIVCCVFLHQNIGRNELKLNVECMLSREETPTFNKNIFNLYFFDQAAIIAKCIFDDLLQMRE